MSLLPAEGVCVVRSSAVIDGYRVKCDPGGAARLVSTYGGRLETSTVTIYPDGSELLGPWRETPPEVMV